MIPRQQSAGTSGIVAGISLAILFFLYITSGASPDTFADPAKALPFIQQNAGRFRTVAIFAIITIAFAVLFVAGLSGKLRDRTPTRATGVLYFGILGVIGHGLGALLFWSGVPALVAQAAKDPVSAQHAWVAINALTMALDGFGNLFVGLSILLAGWAITSVGTMSSTLGWYGVIAGIVTLLATIVPGVMILVLGSFILPIIWLLWAGNTLRTAM